MNYMKVKWKHSDPNYPTLILSEYDENGWEIRKVEIYEDGRIESASSDLSTEGTKLSIEPLPSINEIASDPQFEPIEIPKTEFEQAWERRQNR